MFVAKEESGKLISLLEEQGVKGRYYHCPLCQGLLRLKSGAIMREHFAHQSLGECDASWENESKEHLELKSQLFSWGKQNHPIQVEYLLPEIRQIADLFLGESLALEIQCSSLTQKRLRERSKSYYDIGRQVIWLLGEKLWLGKRLTPLQKDFLYFSKNMGFYVWELDLGKSYLRLKFLIHQDWRGDLYYKVKEFPFGQGDLLEILRLPYQEQSVHSYLAPTDKKLLSYIRRQLYYKQGKWLRFQERLYQKGENLLEKDLAYFYPQVRPLKSQTGFSQIHVDLGSYYQEFLNYYQKDRKKELQIVYSPAYYHLLNQRNSK